MLDKFSIKNLSADDLRGKKVFLRLDLNVPIESGEVKETFRLERALPTIEYLQERGAKLVIASHLGDGEASLEPVVKYFPKNCHIKFVADFHDITDEDFANGGAVLLENLRRYTGEEANSRELAREWANLTDIYINDAFAVSHREHASVVALPELLPSYFGLQFEAEWENLSKALKPQHPFILILGGAKFETKVPLLERFLQEADAVYIYGAIANTFLKAGGHNVGLSRVDGDLSGAKKFLNNPKIHLPSEVVVETRGKQSVKNISEVGDEDNIVDAGAEAVQVAEGDIKSAKFLLWNGPLGNFEKGYGKATKDLARIIAEAGAFSIVGGGDTIAAIKDLDLEDKFGFLSTAGGAMLDFLANGTLPGIEAITKK